MLVYSESVDRVLDRLFWQDFAKTGKVSNIYYECIEALKSIENSIVTIYAQKPLSWKREKATIIKVRDYHFLYQRFTDGVVVEEVYDSLKDQIITEKYIVNSCSNALYESIIYSIAKSVKQLLLNEERKARGYWNEETCREEAKKYKSRTEFQKNSVRGYKVASINGWLDDYDWFNEKLKRNYWNEETCKEEAKKYKSRGEFKKSGSAYNVALKNGWLKDYDWFIS